MCVCACARVGRCVRAYVSIAAVVTLFVVVVAASYLYILYDFLLFYNYIEYFTNIGRASRDHSHK